MLCAYVSLAYLGYKGSAIHSLYTRAPFSPSTGTILGSASFSKHWLAATLSTGPKYLTRNPAALNAAKKSFSYVTVPKSIVVTSLRRGLTNSMNRLSRTWKVCVA